VSYVATGDWTAEEIRRDLIARYVERQKQLGKDENKVWAQLVADVESGKVTDPKSPCWSQGYKNICTKEDFAPALELLRAREKQYRGKPLPGWVFLLVAAGAAVLLIEPRR
jgi:hypothetical protein